MAQRGRVRNKFDILTGCKSKAEMRFMKGKILAAKRAGRPDAAWDGMKGCSCGEGWGWPRVWADAFIGFLAGMMAWGVWSSLDVVNHDKRFSDIQTALSGLRTDLPTLCPPPPTPTPCPEVPPPVAQEKRPRSGGWWKKR